jgi:hypothetical protein
MNGKERAQLQEYSGVREIVSDLDKIRCKYGIRSVNILTPRAEINIRLGKIAQIPLKYEVVHDTLPYKVIIEFPMQYPLESLNVVLEPTNPDDENNSDISILLEKLSEFSVQHIGSIGYGIELLHVIETWRRDDASCANLRCADGKIVDTAITSAQKEPPPATSASATTSYKCRKCRFLLFSADLIEAHTRPHKASPICSSIFLSEPNEDHWLQAVVTADVTGKIHCPSCESKVGAFNWAGSKCSCK